MAETSPTFLQRLHDQSSPDDPVWAEFDQIFRPVVTAHAREAGLRAADAEDVAQLTLADAAADFHRRYDEGRGRLRSWLYGIARRRIAAVIRTRTVRRECEANGVLSDMPCEQSLEESWDAEWTRAVLCDAVARLRTQTRLDERTITAFLLIATRGLTPQDVSESLGMPVENVNLAKHRCLVHVRRHPLLNELLRS